MTADFLVRAALLFVAVVILLRLAHEQHQRRKLGPYADLMSPEGQACL